MSSSRIIRHIQSVLNQCGDPVFLQPTGNETLADPGRMSIEINMVMLKKQNNCFTVPVGEFADIDHLISLQTDHRFRAKLTT